MYKFSEVSDLIADALRDIPALVAEFGGDATRIVAYHPSWPQENNWQEAFRTMAWPCALLIFQSQNAGKANLNYGANQTYQLYLKASEEAAYQASYGTRVSVDSRLHEQQLASGVEIADIPTISRAEDEAGVSYFVITYTVSLYVIGD